MSLSYKIWGTLKLLGLSAIGKRSSGLKDLLSLSTADSEQISSMDSAFSKNCWPLRDLVCIAALLSHTHSEVLGEAPVLNANQLELRSLLEEIKKGLKILPYQLAHFSLSCLFSDSII